MADTTDHVLYTIAAGVATITLNRPDSRNALSAEVVNGLGDGLVRARDDDGVRVVVLTNNGPAFCAGADLKGTSREQPRYTFPEVLDLIQLGPKPVVGRIAGHCTGGGVGLAAACDLSVVVDEAMFGFTEVRIGAAAAMISVVCLPKLRRGDAMELLLGGDKVPARRAADVGLVNTCVAAQDLDAAVDELVGRLLRGGPRALAASKDLVNRVPGMQRDEAFAWTQQLSAELFLGEEAAAGIAAFRERRDPPWVPQA